MKRFITAIVIFIVMILVSCLSLNFVVENSAKLEKELDEMIKLAEEGNMDGALKKAAEFSEEWERCEPYMIMMIRHNSIDEITIRSSKLKSYAKYGNQGDFISEASAIRMLLKHISEDEKPLLHNFM